MANPNIAALNELHVGTLSWTLKSKQVIPVNSNNTYTGSGSTLTYEHNFKNTFNNQTFSDFLIAGLTVSGSPGDNANYPTIVTVDGDATSWVTDKVWDSNNDSGRAMKNWYKVLGDGTAYMDANNATILCTYNASAGSPRHSGNSMILANVDQSTPFATFSRSFSGGVQYGAVTGSEVDLDAGIAPTNYLYTNFNTEEGMNYMNYDTSIIGNAGDMIFVMFQSDQTGDWLASRFWQGTTNGAYDDSAIGSVGTWAVSGFDYGVFNPDVMRFGAITHDYGEGDTGNRQAMILHIQSSQTKDTLITVPTHRVLKINSIVVTNAQSGGMYASIDLDGLGTTINDTAAADAVGGSGADATVALAKDVRIPTGGKGINIIDRPFYMVEGDMLKASVNSTIHDIYHFETEANIIVSFESMED